MKAAWKDSLRRGVTHFFDEKKGGDLRVALRTVREDSGCTFHDRDNVGSNNVMIDVTTRINTNPRAGKGMTLRRFLQKKESKSDGVAKVMMVDRFVKSQALTLIVLIGLATISMGLAQGLGQQGQLGQLGLGNSGIASEGVSDQRLERYSTIVDILDESMFEFTARPERSRERLALAKETFDLIRQGSSGGLIQGLDNTFARADTAITNQSSADFEIQTGLIMGGLQRFLYETASREAQDGNLPIAQAYIKRIVEDLSVLEGDKIRLSQAVDAGALQAALEIAAGQSINAHLDSAAVALTQENHESAYVSLANAYSGFITVQDSLSMPQPVSQGLLTAIQDVVAKKPQAADNVAVVQQDIASYIQFNESVLEKFNADLLGQTGQTGQAGQAQNSLESQAVNQNSLNANSGLGQSAISQAGAQAGSLQSAVAEELAQQGTAIQSGAQAITSLPGLNANGSEATLGAAGQAAQTALGAGTGLARGVEQGMQQGIEQGTQALSNGAAQAVTLGAPSIAGNGTNANLSLGRNQANGQQGSTGLSLNQSRPNQSRPSTSASNNSRSAVQAKAPVAEQSFLAGMWNGIPKAIVMLLLAIASIIPLYLLQLAFGSGSSSWHWVRLAVFLLLLPIMLEGIASLGAALASVTGISALGLLTPFTVSGGALGQIIWAVTSLIAIAALCFGLWGICKQFGLLGQAATEEDADLSDEASMGMHTDAGFQTNPSALTERFTLEEGPVGTVMDMGNETVIEWEEEF